MAIQIIPRGKPIPVSRISVTIMGPPGIGKSTLANTATKPLLLDFDRGSHRSLNRPDTVYIESWQDIEEMTKDDVSGYGTIITDTVGRCLDALVADIIEREPNMAMGGQLKIQGYGRLKSRFRSWLNLMHSYGLDVVMIAHAVEERHGDDVKLRVDGQGSGKEEVYKTADLMGRLTMVNERDQRGTINWNPHVTGFGKNPARLPTEIVPDVMKVPDYLHGCMRTTLDFLQRASEDSTNEELRVRQLREHFKTTLKTPDDFTERAKQMAEVKAPRNDKAALLGVAEELGYEYDKEKGGFVDPNAPKDEQESTADDASDGDADDDKELPF